VQNGQGEKRQFAAASRADDYLANPLREPISPWEVKAGTVIPAALITAINSDLPGEVIAQVTEPVYDHATGRTVLIPQGSRLIGQYDSQVAYGQERALIAWNRVIMPNGNSINIGSMTGADLTGASGLRDRVNDHFGQLAKGILISTLFSVGAASAQDASAQASGNLVVNSAGSGVANNAQEVGQRITERDLSRQPTITVRAGWPLRVLVSKDIILAPYQ
jgi:type IV secretory pathway VirB10-like protein